MSRTVQDQHQDQPPQPAPPAPRRRLVVVVGVVALVVVLVVAGLVALLTRDDDTAAPAPSPGPSAPESPAPDPTPTGDGAVVDLLDVGAVGDGSTDDTEALQAAFDAAQPGDVLQLPRGHTFAYDDVLTLASPGVTLTGGGTLLATNEERSSFTLAADDVLVQDVVLHIVETTRRWDAFEQQRLRIDGHDGVVVRDVTIEGSAAAGVYVGGAASNFLLDSLEVSGTRADGIHMTQGSHDGRVVSPVVRDVGDDGVAVVSYAPDGDPCARIEIDSPVVDGTDARGISVVGGTDITYRDIDVSGTYAAGVYISAEGSYDTASVDGVVVEGGTVTRANVSEEIDHGSVLVFNGTRDKTVTDVRISGLAINDTRETASRQVGLLSDTPDGISDVVLTDLTFTPGGPERMIVSNEAGTTYRAEGWTQDGDALPDVADEVVGTD